jgi:hypothetical protein
VEKEEDTKTMIKLTQDQMERLKAVSSGLRPDQRATLTLEQSEAIAKGIDAVLYELHMENPSAFVTNASLTLSGVEFLPMYSAVRRRRFYDEPLKVEKKEYATHVRPLPKNKYL